jgi:hypothetical protein
VETKSPKCFIGPNGNPKSLNITPQEKRILMTANPRRTCENRCDDTLHYGLLVQVRRLVTSCRIILTNGDGFDQDKTNPHPTIPGDFIFRPPGISAMLSNCSHCRGVMLTRHSGYLDLCALGCDNADLAFLAFIVSAGMSYTQSTFLPYKLPN